MAIKEMSGTKSAVRTMTATVAKTVPVSTVKAKELEQVMAMLSAIQNKPTESVDSLVRLSRAELIAKLTTKFGKAPPKSWTRLKMANGLVGTDIPKGSYGKACATARYAEVAGVLPAKSWTVAKISAKMGDNMTAPVLPKGKTTKADLTAQYIAKTGFLPLSSPKS